MDKTRLTRSQAAFMFSVLGNEDRLCFFEFLSAGQAKTIEIADYFGISPSRLNFHLNLMINSAIAKNLPREGRDLIRALEPRSIQALIDYLGGFLDGPPLAIQPPAEMSVVELVDSASALLESVNPDDLSDGRCTATLRSIASLTANLSGLKVVER